MSNSAAAPTFAGLDLIRFGAAFYVMFFHLAYKWWVPTETSSSPLFSDLSHLHEIARWGWVGVPIFFVLSGFVIAFSATGKTARQFVSNRITRLYPAAWICATITFVVWRYPAENRQ